MNDKNLIIRFMEAFAVRDFSTMKELYSQDVQFFDPLFEYVSDGAAVDMWQFRFALCEVFELTFDNYNDEGEGYHTCYYRVKWNWGKADNQVIDMKMKAYFRVRNNQITEHSDGFSVHEWCSQRFGWSGKLFGWNRIYQQSVKNKIRKAFLHKKR